MELGGGLEGPPEGKPSSPQQSPIPGLCFCQPAGVWGDMVGWAGGSLQGCGEMQ